VSYSILVVDDDDGFRSLVSDILAGDGHQVKQAPSAENALEQLAKEPVDLVITDQRMPGLDGLELTRRLRGMADPPLVLVMTAYGTIPQAVEAVRAGASDYLTKPLESPAALRNLVRRALGGPSNRTDTGDEFLTRDPAALEMLSLADRAAATDATVLVIGESGTGKELVARRIHARSRRASNPFVAVNCAAIPENLAESELFGHERGAFTGADRRRQGRFEQADGGTLLLDELGELHEAVQAKLLRALEEKAIERVGGSNPVPVDIRLIAATHRDLDQAVADGAFRADFYYRLNVMRLEIPPLRQRPEDIGFIADHLLPGIVRRLGSAASKLDATALRCLRAHGWPGNVRELRNVIERVLIITGGGLITAEDLPGLAAGSPKPTSRTFSEPAGQDAPMSLSERERQAILEALHASNGHREQAARLLGISVRTLYNRLRQFGIG